MNDTINNTININNTMDMDRESFERLLTDALRGVITPGANIDFHDTIKNNGAYYRAVSVRIPERRVAPNFRVDEYFDLYKKGEMNIGEIASLIMEKTLESDTDVVDTVESFIDFSKAKENIFMRLISYKCNKDRLDKYPYRKFLDLALVYYYAIFDDERGVNGLIKIENDHLKMWGKCEDDIFETARANTFSKLSYDFIRLDELLLNREISDIPIFALTNKRRYNGAVCIFYPSILREASEMFKTDLLIIPSSIHETIILPYTSESDMKYCNSLIQEVNRDHVAKEEVLSDHAYIYDKKLMSIA